MFVRQELLEWSPVVIPADPGVEILRADGGAFDATALIAPDRTPPSGERTLAEVVDSAHDFIATRAGGVLTPAEREAAARLYGSLGSLVEIEPGLPPRLRDELGRVLGELVGAVRAVRMAVGVEHAHPVFDAEAIVARSAAVATGRSAESILAQLKNGGAQS